MRTLLIKLSGELFSHKEALSSVVTQLKTVVATCRVGIVVGGGNFFRRATDNTQELDPVAADNIGMLATLVNGIVLQDMLRKQNINVTMLSAFECPKVATKISQSAINGVFEQQNLIIFVGGTGKPHFTTDTAAVLRGVQIEADEIWKATKVDGVYDSDPIKNEDATRYPTISYQEVLDKELKIMDKTAITLAQEKQVPIRVFNVFSPKSLVKMLEDQTFGSTIH